MRPSEDCTSCLFRTCCQQGTYRLPNFPATIRSTPSICTGSECELSVFQMVAVFLRSRLRRQTELAAENLALRQQLAVLEHSSKRPKLRQGDRIFWVWLSKLWPNWRNVLLIVQPETVVRRHLQGFKLYWRWKSRSRKPGRPKIDAEIRKLIRRMSWENPRWGTPRIQSELHACTFSWWIFS